MKDKTVTFSISVPENMRDELDKLVNQNSVFANRSHALVVIFEQWKQSKKSPKKSPQLEAA